MCWWDDLIAGQSIRFCLRNSYNCLSTPQWFHATIMEVIPDGEGDGEENFGAKLEVEDTKVPPSKQASKPVDKAGESSETEEGSAPVRPEHWPKNRKLKHRIQCYDGKPWRIPRWVDRGKIQFRLAERNGKVAPLCNLPSLGLHEYPAREDHLGRLESISDPLTDGFKRHIRFKLDHAARRDGMVPGREVSLGAAGTAGADGIYKPKYA